MCGLRSRTLAALTILTMTHRAVALTHVYLRATSGIVAPGGQGEPGHTLQLQAGGGPWMIELRVSTTGCLQTWGVDLGSPNGADSGLQASDPVVNSATWPGASPGVAGSAPALLTGAGFIDFGPPFADPGDYELLRFTLSGGEAGDSAFGVVNAYEFIDVCTGQDQCDIVCVLPPCEPCEMIGTMLTIVSACPTAGDVNCDCRVDVADIPAFALALTNPAAYRGAYPACDIARADLNGDGRMDGLDVRLLVSLLVP